MGEVAVVDRNEVLEFGGYKEYLKINRPFVAIAHQWSVYPTIPFKILSQLKLVSPLLSNSGLYNST